MRNQINTKEQFHFHPGLILLLIIISQLLACKPEALDVKMPKAPEQPSIASQYGIDGILGLVLSKSFDAGKQLYTADSNGIQYDSTLLLSGAIIQIKGGGQTFTLEELEPGIYASSSANLIDGENYQLDVMCADGKTLQASSIKQSKVSFNELSATLSANNKNVLVKFSFNDLPGTDNYYVVNYISGNQTQQVPDKPDPEYIAKRILEQNATYDLIDESLFKAGVYKGEKTINRPSNSDTIAVALTHISKGYYQYLQAQKKAGTLFNQIRAEVVNFPSNIQNGYGYFELNEPDFHLLELE
ncbi:MAG: DUF4249 family protein [Bacteroidia bacterium]